MRQAAGQWCGAGSGGAQLQSCWDTCPSEVTFPCLSVPTMPGGGTSVTGCCEAPGVHGPWGSVRTSSRGHLAGEQLCTGPSGPQEGGQAVISGQYITAPALEALGARLLAAPGHPRGGE